MIWFLIVPALAIALLERWRRTRRQAMPFLRARFADDAAFLLIGWVATARLSLAYVAAFHREHGLFDGLPGWLLVIVAVVLLDLGNYLCHFLLHRVDALWEFHKVHHSSPSLDWLATFRSHLVEQIVRRLLAPVGLIVVGFPLGVVALAAGLLTAWGILNHANLRIVPQLLEPFFITPRLHLIHHQRHTSERNLGTLLTLWDRLRGTFTREEPAGELGVPDERYPQGFFVQMREPFRRLKSRVPVTLLVCLFLVGCAAQPTQTRPKRCDWEISGDVGLPRDL